MNKAAGAGIGIGILLIAIAALYMTDMSDESDTQVDLSEDVEMSAEETKSYEVNIDEGIKIGDKPP